MTMSVSGFPTKKSLKAHVGKDFTPHVVETSIFGPEYNPNGVNTVVGPSPYERKWFARVKCENGILRSVE